MANGALDGELVANRDRGCTRCWGEEEVSGIDGREPCLDVGACVGCFGVY
jgi:hypothetical protein